MNERGWREYDERKDDWERERDVEREMRMNDWESWCDDAWGITWRHVVSNNNSGSVPFFWKI